MKITGIVWLSDIRDKIVAKHGVSPTEVHEILESKPHVRHVRKGNRRGEDVYVALGRTAAGRLLIIFFIRKVSGNALVISAREMDAKERRLYEKSKG